MTLADALKIALAAYDEDEAEREAVLEKLTPVLLGDRELLRAAIVYAWSHTPQLYDGRADEIRAALTEYQVERAEIDAEASAAASQAP
jgi:hypothetical protein